MALFAVTLKWVCVVSLKKPEGKVIVSGTLKLYGGMTPSNELGEKGSGVWLIRTYQPKATIGPIKSNLYVAKDFHMFYVPSTSGERKVIANIPSQNIAYVLDPRYVPSTLYPDDEEAIKAMSEKSK